MFGSRKFSVEAVSVAEALGLPGNPLQTVELVRNKQACRDALRKSGFRQSEVALCSNLDEAYAFISEHPAGPWIMKPPAATGSAGVSLVRSAGELEQAFAYLAQSCKALDQKLRQLGIAEESLAQAVNIPFLVECFQSGEEYSAEGVFVYGQPHVLVITSKVTLGPPHFVEVGHAMSAELPRCIADGQGDSRIGVDDSGPQGDSFL